MSGGASLAGLLAGMLGEAVRAKGTSAVWRTALVGTSPGGKRGTMGRFGKGVGAPGRLGMEVGSGVVE